MTTCNICIEDYNKSNRSKITCDYCDFESCKECVKKYILDLTEDIHCMNCKKFWNRKYVNSKFEKNFVDKQLKSRREDILLDRERSLFPSTQPYIERKIRNEKIDLEIYSLQRKIDKIQSRIEELRNEQHRLHGKNLEEKRIFIQPCSNTNCKGFLSTQWKCGLCEKYTCSDCNEVIEDEHKCDPNMVETAKSLKKDTKPCPKCATRIFKIDGCDQMFCTQCHTAFSWNSGKIETHRIHNPHYFEWIRNSGKTAERNNEEILCGREIDGYFFSTLNRKLKSSNIFYVKVPYFQKFENLLESCRKVIHITQVDIPKFGVNRISDNLGLRMDFMMNKIDEKTFKTTLQRREKEISKKTEIQNILRMFVACVTDIFYRLMDELDKNRQVIKISEDDKDDNEIEFNTRIRRENLERNRAKIKYFYNIPYDRIEHIKDNISECESLVNYVNDCLKDVSSTYKCKIYTITDLWNFL